jgi:hypothetical protein
MIQAYMGTTGNLAVYGISFFGMVLAFALHIRQARQMEDKARNKILKKVFFTHNRGSDIAVPRSWDCGRYR